MNTITGTLKHKYEKQQVTPKFAKLEFVIETEGEYPQEILLQLTQDNCSKLAPFKVGDILTAHYNLRGRGFVNKEGVKKYYNSIEVWKISGLGTPDQTISGSSKGIDADPDLPF